MTEPNDPTPAPEETPTNWIAVVSSYKPTIDRFLLVMTSLIALAGAVYNGCQASKHTEQLSNVEQKAEVASDKADKAAAVGIENKALNAKSVATLTGDPKDEKLAKEAEKEAEQVKAATQEAK